MLIITIVIIIIHELKKTLTNKKEGKIDVEHLYFFLEILLNTKNFCSYQDACRQMELW